MENLQIIQFHLTTLQSVIQRMAANSSSSKAWCVTLVSAILAIIADKGKSQYIWLAFIPTFMFLVLDAYYLGLERRFRNAYNEFIKKLHEQTLQPEDLFVVVPQGRISFFYSLSSFSVWPFYGALAAMIYAAALAMGS